MTETNESQYARLFSRLSQVEMPAGLESVICKRIRVYRLRKIKLQLAMLCSAAAASLVATIYAVAFLARSFFESGFSDYLSVLMSSDSSLISYWKEGLYSLVETVPVGGLTVVLALVAILVWSVARATKNADAVLSGRIFAR